MRFLHTSTVSNLVRCQNPKHRDSKGSRWMLKGDTVYVFSVDGSVANRYYCVVCGTEHMQNNKFKGDNGASS